MTGNQVRLIGACTFLSGFLGVLFLCSLRQRWGIELVGYEGIFWSVTSGCLMFGGITTFAVSFDYYDK